VSTIRFVVVLCFVAHNRSVIHATSHMSVDQPQADGAERAKRLKNAREAKGLRHEDVAAMTGIHRSSIIRHEKTGPPWEAAKKYAKALEIDAREIGEVLSPTVLESIQAMEQILALLIASVPPGRDSPWKDQETEVRQRAAELLKGPAHQARRLVDEDPGEVAP
jgi:DNA-binding XRE family transcriptional regulator